MLSIHLRRFATSTARAALLAATVALSACGGGGGGGGGAAMPPSAGPIATETAPVGPRVDLVAAGYMPFVQGSVWVYSVRDASGNELTTQTRTLSQVPAGGIGTLQFTVSEGGVTEFETYRMAADGLFVSLEEAGLPAAAQAAIGEIREYAFPSYAAGEARQVVRAGSLGVDLDGDGVDETFRLEYTQTYDGLVPLALPWDAAATVARFTASTFFVIHASATSTSYGAVTRTQNDFAKDIGPVGGTESVEDLSGARLSYRNLVVKSATVNGITRQSLNALGVALSHNDMVYDATRDLYYASVPSTDAANGNRIATITPSTGAIAYSAATVGGNPGVLAVAPGGQYLYVGLKGASEVVKLALPGLAEVGRIQLGSGAFGSNTAESIAVSPADPDVLAVSLQAASVVPHHQGVVLVQGTTIAPVSTQVHTGSNLIAFNADGTLLYGINNETTEYGLREISVAADGLRETRVVTAEGGTLRLQFAAGSIYTRTRAWTTGLLQAGQFGDGSARQCSRLASGRVACLPSFGATWLSLYDPATFAATSTVDIPADASAASWLVPGAAGSLALSRSGTQVWLLRDARL